MSIQEQSGRELKRIIFPGPPEESLVSNQEWQIVFESSYHGDHDELWAVVKVRSTGQELERHNIRYISSLVWNDPLDCEGEGEEE